MAAEASMTQPTINKKRLINSITVILLAPRPVINCVSVCAESARKKARGSAYRCRKEG
ncbi:hypothetical protein SAMN05216343_11476 [Oscillibacter sp. PC13]|nr:hypothetical protein SAMN05216343_11476 [Oscillibacter sp. PC13]